MSAEETWRLAVAWDIPPWFLGDGNIPRTRIPRTWRNRARWTLLWPKRKWQLLMAGDR